MSIKIGIIGNGQVGSFIYQSYVNDRPENQEFITIYSRKDGFDVTKYKTLKSIVKENNIIINCAAFTDVNAAEFDKLTCKNVNYNAVKKLTDLIKNTNKKFIHFSSDFVYGENGIENELLETDECKPCNYYGKTKLMADNYILKNMSKNFLILRPSWVFGPNGNNFIDKLIEGIKNNKEIRVVNDQYGFLTSTYLIYKVVKLYIDSKLNDGLYNICCSKTPNLDKPSRYDIALKLINFMKIKNISVIPCKSSDFITPAKRQSNSILNCQKLDNEILKHSNLSRTSWEIELSNYLQLNIKNQLK